MSDVLCDRPRAVQLFVRHVLVQTVKERPKPRIKPRSRSTKSASIHGGCTNANRRCTQGGAPEACHRVGARYGLHKPFLVIRCGASNSAGSTRVPKISPLGRSGKPAGRHARTR
jgi:hypothetical protein